METAIDIDPTLHQTADMSKDAIPVQFARGIPGGRHGRPAEQAKLGIARRLQLGVTLLHDPLDITDGEQTPQPVAIVNDQ